MLRDPAAILLVPGPRAPGPEHWLSHWAAGLPGAHTLAVADAPRPQLGQWVDQLTALVLAQPGPVALAAHDLGCLAAVNLGPEAAARVRGALLVAPCDPTRRAVLSDFAPVPYQPLPFPSIVVASNDDPACSLRLAGAFARSWRSQFLRLQDAGHVDESASLGAWPLGLALLRTLAEAPSVPALPLVPSLRAA